MTNENIIHMETNAPVLEQENIQETLEIPGHSTECDFLCSNLKGLPHLSPQKCVGTEGDIIWGQYICKGKKHISIRLEQSPTTSWGSGLLEQRPSPRLAGFG